MWIGLLTIVIHPQLCKLRHELDEIEKAPCVSLTNSFLRDVVPASLDTRMHARYVQLGVSETDTPDAHLDSRLHGLLQKRRNRSSAKRGLKSIVKALRILVSHSRNHCTRVASDPAVTVSCSIAAFVSRSAPTLSQAQETIGLLPVKQTH